jgi:hypothetical protein
VRDSNPAPHVALQLVQLLQLPTQSTTTSSGLGEGDGDSGAAAGEVPGAGTNGSAATAVTDNAAGVAAGCTGTAETLAVAVKGVPASQVLNSVTFTNFVRLQLCDASAASGPGAQSATGGLKAQLFSVALPVLVMVRVQVRLPPADTSIHGSKQDK